MAVKQAIRVTYSAARGRLTARTADGRSVTIARDYGTEFNFRDAAQAWLDKHIDPSFVAVLDSHGLQFTEGNGVYFSWELTR